MHYGITISLLVLTLGREARLGQGGQSLGAGPEGPDHLRIDD